MTGVLVGLLVLAGIVAWVLHNERLLSGSRNGRGCGWCGYRHGRRGYALCQRCGRDREGRSDGIR